MAHASLLPIDDPARLAALPRLGPLHRAVWPSLDRLARLFCKTLSVPFAMISLVDAERQLGLSRGGLPEPLASQRELPVSQGLCQYTVATNAPFVVSDAAAHPLVRDHPARSNFGAVAYAGIPLCIGDRYAIGALCVIDTAPRDWTSDEIEMLQDFKI